MLHVLPGVAGAVENIFISDSTASFTPSIPSASFSSGVGGS